MDAEKLLKDKLKEVSTMSSVAVPQGPTGQMKCGTPYFDCDEDMFYSLHLKKRKSGQWFRKHYKDSEVANWARKNKGKSFYLKHNNMFRKVT